MFEQLPRESGGVYRLSRDDYRAQHMLRILKLQPGDLFVMGVVSGLSGQGRLESLDGRDVCFTWSPGGEGAKSHPVVLTVGCVRPICMKRILREAASLGVQKLQICGTDLGEKSYFSAGLWKDQTYRTHLIDGASQAGVTAVPEVSLFPRLTDALSEAKEGAKLVLDLADGAVPLSRIQLPKEYPLRLAVGSERGWSRREQKLFAREGWIPVSLGTHILRTETACASGTAVLLARFGLI